MITSGQYDESQAAYIAYNFDYHAVESVTGFDRHEVMASINDYDDKLDKLGILGYLDIGYILTEAIVNVVPTTYYKPARQQIVSTDYFQLLSDILNDEEELIYFNGTTPILLRGINEKFDIDYGDNKELFKINVVHESDKTDENPTDYTHKTQSLRCCTIPVITGAEFNIMKSSPIMNDATPAAVPNF